MARPPLESRSNAGSRAYHELPGEAQRHARREHPRLQQVGAHAPIERRPLAVDGARARAAEQVQVLPLDLAAGAFLGSVADAGADLPQLVAGHRHVHRHPAVHHRLAHQLHVRELEQLHVVEPLLAHRGRGQAELVAGLERQRAPHHVVVHALVALDRNLAVAGRVAGVGGQGHDHRRADHRRFGHVHLREGIAGVLQRTHRHAVRGANRGVVQHGARFERDVPAQLRQVVRWQHVETHQVQLRDQARGAFVHRDRQRHRVLLLVQLRVHRRDLRVAVAAVLIETDDALEVVVERAPIEVALAAPEEAAADARAKHGPDLPGGDGPGAFDIELGDLDQRCRLTPARRRPVRLRLRH